MSFEQYRQLITLTMSQLKEIAQILSLGHQRAAVLGGAATIPGRSTYDLLTQIR